MIILDSLSQLPLHTVFRVRTSKTPCEDADYVYLHKSLMYYSCYFNVPVIESKKKQKKLSS